MKLSQSAMWIFIKPMALKTGAYRNDVDSFQSAVSTQTDLHISDVSLPVRVASSDDESLGSDC